MKKNADSSNNHQGIASNGIGLQQQNTSNGEDDQNLWSNGEEDENLW